MRLSRNWGNKFSGRRKEATAEALRPCRALPSMLAQAARSGVLGSTIEEIGPRSF